MTAFHPPVLLLIGLVMVVFQLVTIGMAVIYMHKKYRWLEWVKSKHATSNALLVYLDGSLSQMKALERCHLLNIQSPLTTEIENLVQSLWVEIGKALGQCQDSAKEEGSKFSMLSVQGGFDLYREMQERFLTHSNAGDKAFAEHLLNSSGQEIYNNLKLLLETARSLDSHLALTQLEADDSMSYAWIAYPTVALIFSVAAFLAVYALYA
jgi:hypothetical protein